MAILCVWPGAARGALTAASAHVVDQAAHDAIVTASVRFIRCGEIRPNSVGAGLDLGDPRQVTAWRRETP